MPAPQLPLSQVPSQNPHSPVTSDHAIWAVSIHSSTHSVAPLSAHISASLMCSRNACVTQSAVRCLKRNPRPQHSRCRFWVASTYPRFRLGIAFHPIDNRFAVPFDLQGRPLPSFQYIKYQWRQVPWFLRRPGPFGFGFLFHRLVFTDSH